MSKRPARVGPHASGDNIHVVIETPSGSRWKYSWDPEARAFSARKLLPLGITFPFDFGFVPGTLAADGDPLDVLVLADAPLAVGALVECRVLGALEIEQSEEGNGEPVRNDRLIAVPLESQRGAHWKDLHDLDDLLLDEIKAFLRDYVQREGRTFKLLDTVEHEDALHLVDEATQ